MIPLMILCVLLFLVQGLAALPWLRALSYDPFRTRLPFYAKVAGITALGGIPFAFILQGNSDPDVVALWGRFYGSVLLFQLGIGLCVLTFFSMLTFWSKGGAVALAAFQEGIRQPMFWLLSFLGTLAMVVSIVIPYFTFGEDLKMVKEITYAMTMMFPALFAVISSSVSVSEEIEGRTAVTLLSTPITRRDFLLGKYLGIMLAAMVMTMILGYVLVWVHLAKFNYDFMQGVTQTPPDPDWLTGLIAKTYERTTPGDLIRGIGLWLRDSEEAFPGLVIGFGQVATLLAVSVALATRLPMVVNISMCLVVYLLGHLAPVMTEVSQGLALVQFVAQLFELLLPGLPFFDVSTAIVRETPPDPTRYALYTLNVAIYAAIYTMIALLAGLILFEDRDVA